MRGRQGNPGSACQNPSLTYMALTALTARAADYAVKAMRRREI
ncbi:hypothetical protein [Fibrella aquatilis]|nr:hypothetical protein [Fibrella aquatilis]